MTAPSTSSASPAWFCGKRHEMPKGHSPRSRPPVGRGPQAHSLVRDFLIALGSTTRPPSGTPRVSSTTSAPGPWPRSVVFWTDIDRPATPGKLLAPHSDLLGVFCSLNSRRSYNWLIECAAEVNSSALGSGIHDTVCRDSLLRVCLCGRLCNCRCEAGDVLRERILQTLAAWGLLWTLQNPRRSCWLARQVDQKV